MTTIISVFADRGCVGLCDARCYNAKQPSELKEPRRNACICICGGRNHGVGVAQAVRNNHRDVGLTREDLQQFAQRHDLNPDDLVVVDRMRCPSVRAARTLALKLLNPPALVPGEDLFACEEVAS